MRSAGLNGVGLTIKRGVFTRHTEKNRRMMECIPSSADWVYLGYDVVIRKFGGGKFTAT
jgi:hypothetical protein